METRVFNFENCTVRVHIPENNHSTVRKATEDFLKRVIKEREVVNERKN